MNIRTLRLSFTALLLALGIAAQAQSETKLMTYNIKGHSMTDKRMGNIAKVIKYNMPDVVALQEVDNRNYLGGKKDYIGMLSKETGMHAQFHALVGTYYGIGILSKEKPLSVNFRTWERGEDSSDRENRGCIIAEFDDYYFISTHYSLNDKDRDKATVDLIKFAKSAGKPVFIAGDFNAKPTYRAMVTFKNNGFKILNNTDEYTFPSDKPESCIDMVIYYDSTASYEFKVTESGIALSNGVNINDESATSDHLPVFVELSYATGISQTSTATADITIASGSITNHGAQKANVEVYTTSGQKTFACTLAPNEKQTLSLPKGMYIVRATNSKGVTNGKVLIN